MMVGLALDASGGVGGAKPVELLIGEVFEHGNFQGEGSLSIKELGNKIRQNLPF